MDSNRTFNEMMFLSYQPFFKREDGGVEMDNINAGGVRTEAILKRDEEIVSRLGYNPYWAVGGKTIKDIILGSIFCAPNNPYVAHIFQTDEYLKVNKVKQELHAYEHIKGNFLDFVDENISDDCAEYLVKDMNKGKHRIMYDLFKILEYNRPDFSVKDGVVVDSGIFTGLPKEFLEDWSGEVKKCCDFVFGNCHFDRSGAAEIGLSGEGADIFFSAKLAKIVFEVVILPVILELFCRIDNTEIVDDKQRFDISAIWTERLRYTFRQMYSLYETFVVLCEKGILDEITYSHIMQQGRELIIDNDDVLFALYEKKMYPNDPCPCGSGKKFKKCHGQIRYEHTW